MIEFKVKHNMASNTHILTCVYEGDQLIAPLDKKEGILTSLFTEQMTQHLMNLCIAALRDYKDQKLRREQENADRVRFIGVDYS